MVLILAVQKCDDGTVSLAAFIGPIGLRKAASQTVPSSHFWAGAGTGPSLSGSVRILIDLAGFRFLRYLVYFFHLTTYLNHFQMTQYWSLRMCRRLWTRWIINTNVLWRFLCQVCDYIIQNWFPEVRWEAYFIYVLFLICSCWVRGPNSLSQK